jgi:methionyl-tRNA synthetase
MKLATAVNQYLDQTSPWSEIKKDKSEAAKTIYTALRAIDSLKVLFAPFLPFTSEKLHQYLGYDTPLFGEQYVEQVEDSLGTHNVLRYRDVSRTDSPTYWKRSQLEPNQKLREPGPLFKKLEDSVVEEERARLGK